MRHFKSRRNALLVEFGVTRSPLYFPDTNETTWRWSSAFERAPDWHMPDPVKAWWCRGEDGDAFSGYMWWIDQEGSRWKIGGHGDPKPA